MTRASRAIPFFILISFVIISGCYSKLKVKDVESGRIESEDIKVEAYLFDVKLRRKGKPTSIRLDLYQTDSIVAMYGRGYFNKGAFSGRLTADSMQIYFPSTQEFLFESIEDLFLSFDCESELIGIELFSYFSGLPEIKNQYENLFVEKLTDENDRKSFEISSRNCPWVLLLTYSYEETGWRIDNFEFDDYHEVTLKGSRRIYKKEAAVESGRFKIEIPSGAFKIKL